MSEIQIPKRITLFNNQLIINISADDWLFLCGNVFYTDEPDQDDIEAEFVTGTGITPKKQHLWCEATDRFTNYINDMKKIKALDINKMCRESISNSEKI